MKTSKEMQKVITQLAKIHGLDLEAMSDHVRVENPPFMPLVVEKISKCLVSVAHY